MAHPSDLDRIADGSDRPAGEVMRLLILSLDADGQQQLNRFAHCSKTNGLAFRARDDRSREADFPCDVG
jgi:hypothetical protein